MFTKSSFVVVYTQIWSSLESNIFGFELEG